MRSTTPCATERGPIAIVGAGLIGRAWAIVFARAGHPVRLHDMDLQTMQNSHAYIEARLNELAEFEKWTNAKTENTEVNAIIGKLVATGNLTAAERTLAADYLANEMGINWTWGAMYYESFLTDYNVSGNWSRWNHIAGVGSV